MKAIILIKQDKILDVIDKLEEKRDAAQSQEEHSAYQFAIDALYEVLD